MQLAAIWKPKTLYLTVSVCFGFNHYMQVEDVLEDLGTLFKDHYYIKTSGNCDLSRMSDPHNEFGGKNVPIERKAISYMAAKVGMSTDQYGEHLGMCRERLYNIRSRRPRPHLDDKVSSL